MAIEFSLPVVDLRPHVARDSDVVVVTRWIDQHDSRHQKRDKQGRDSMDRRRLSRWVSFGRVEVGTADLR
jgi:hypothetical protein